MCIMIGINARVPCSTHCQQQPRAEAGPEEVFSTRKGIAAARYIDVIIAAMLELEASLRRITPPESSRLLKLPAENPDSIPFRRESRWYSKFRICF